MLIGPYGEPEDYLWLLLVTAEKFDCDCYLIFGQERGNQRCGRNRLHLIEEDGGTKHAYKLCMFGRQSQREKLILIIFHEGQWISAVHTQKRAGSNEVFRFLAVYLSDIVAHSVVAGTRTLYLGTPTPRLRLMELFFVNKMEGC